VLFHSLSRVFVVAQSYEFGMPLPIRICPFQELYLSYSLRSELNTFLHFLGCRTQGWRVVVNFSYPARFGEAASGAGLLSVVPAGLKPACR
jgi:hypothetical protein